MEPVTVVTGGASGIGAAVVTRLRADGHHVAILDRDPPTPVTGKGFGDEPAGRDSKTLPYNWGWGPAAYAAYAVDVRDEGAVRETMGAVAGRFGRVDNVVHCAAIAQHGEPAAELPAATFREILDVNVTGSFLVARAAAELMADGGSIVLLSSPSAFRARPGMAAYGASKAGVIALTQSLAVEFAPLGIRVNCVSPGVTLTPLMLDSWGARDAEDAFRMADAQAHIPLGRLVLPEEVAATVAYLTSAGAAAMTGHNLVVDGGRSL